MSADRHTRLNQYRSMWIMVFFDLPTDTKPERRAAAKFRKDLLQDGFNMFQFSIYLRFCPSKENSEVHIKRIKRVLPKNGKIGMLTITDRQFGGMALFFGTKHVETEKPYQQLELF